MTIVESLKDLYVAFGGDADDVADITEIAEIIAEIADVAETAVAAELPEVTATENGKVLKVVDGKWAVGTDATA